MNDWATIPNDLLMPSEEDELRRRLSRLVPDEGEAADDRRLIAAAARATRKDSGLEYTADEAVAALRLMPGVYRALQADEVELTEAARDSGVTWKALGEELGDRSPQSVQQRYKRLGGIRVWPTRRPATREPGSRDARNDDRGWLPTPAEWTPNYAAQRALASGITRGLNEYAAKTGCSPLTWELRTDLDPEDAPARLFLDARLTDDALAGTLDDQTGSYDPSKQATLLQPWVELLRLSERPVEYVRNGREWWGYTHDIPTVLRTVVD